MSTGNLAAAAQARKSVTMEQRAQWDAKREKEGGGNDGVPDDVWYAGYWLHEKLTEEGCPEDIASKINFAVGQRQSYETSSDGIWLQAVTALRNYTETGTWEEPGADLAMRLLRERFGDPANALEIAAWLLSHTPGQRALADALSELRSTGKLSEPKTPWDSERP